MGFFPLEGMFQGMGIMKPKSSANLNDPYSAGGSDRYSGLSPEGKVYWNDLRRMLSGDVYGSAYQPFNINYPTTAPTLQLNRLGLTEGQQTGFNEAVNQAASRFSGQFGNKGFNTPRINDAIAGSAAQYVMPQFAPLMTQNLQGLFEQQYRPAAFSAQLGSQMELARRQLMAQSEEARTNQMLNLLNAQQQATGMERGPGLGYQGVRDASSNWYNMWNKIGSFWGGAGGAGVGV